MNLLLLCTVKKGDFLLAEQNEISGNVFLTHCWGLGMGLGHVMCKGGQLFFVDRHCLTFPPTHPRVFWLFISLLTEFRFCFDSQQVHVLTFHVQVHCTLVYFVKLLLLLCQVRLVVVGLTWLPGVCENFQVSFILKIILHMAKTT